MGHRSIYLSGAPWEKIAGYARAVRIGETIEVSGTVAQVDGMVHGKGDALAQTMKILEIIERSVVELGGRKEDIVRTRIFVVDIQRDWQAVGRAHGTFFEKIKPATSMVEVRALISPEYLVEIEATAVIRPGGQTINPA